ILDLEIEVMGLWICLAPILQYMRRGKIDARDTLTNEKQLIDDLTQTTGEHLFGDLVSPSLVGYDLLGLPTCARAGATFPPASVLTGWLKLSAMPHESPLKSH